MNLAAQLADYSLRLTYDDLDERTVHVAKQRLVDTLGCALGGRDAPPVRSIRAYLDTVPLGSATILFSDRKVAPELAAFVNATMVRFLDYNDGYFALEPGHSSDNIPALIAVAETEGLGGREVILAMVIAYEIQMRLQDAASLFRRGWDHVNFVTVSATCAVGRLLGLSRDQLVHALGMALNGHVALRQVRSGELSGWKGASAANATRNAVFCCYLARHDMTGPSDIFEGEMGFFAQVSGPIALDVQQFGNGKTHTYHIKQARTKLYPTNGEMQTAVMAAVSLRGEVGALSSIDKIEVATTDVGYRFLAKDAAKWRPTTRETADHSLPYTVARALIDGTITRATYDAADFNDPDVIAIIDKIVVAEDPDLTAQMPSLANRVTIHMRDGRQLCQEYGTVRSPRINVSDEEIERKFREFASESMAPHAIQRTLELAWAFDQQRSMADLMIVTSNVP